MAVEDIAIVNISLQTTGVTRAGFGTPIFIGAHRWFQERIRTYTDITSVAVDIPTDSQEFVAASAFLSQTPSPTSIKIGRQDTDKTTLTPDAPATGDVFTVTITVNDGDSVAASYTSQVSDTQEDVVDGLLSDIAAVTEVTDHISAVKVGTLSSAVLDIAPVAPATDTYALSAILKITVTQTVTETATAALSAIEAVDNDFYFVTAHDHTETFTVAMATAVESRDKIYFMSSQEQDSIDTAVGSGTDTLAVLFNGNFFRTATFFYHTADTTFPECAWIGFGASFEPGTLTWVNDKVATLGAAQDPSTGLVLSATQRNNLQDRLASSTWSQGGNIVTFGGKVTADEWIDVIRSRDLLVARITEDQQALLINASKIPYTDSGINQVRSTLTGTLNQFISTPTAPNILTESDPYTTTFPRAIDVSDATKALREFTGSFTAILAGAIQLVRITGTLTL